jgi:hypothetical protein
MDAQQLLPCNGQEDLLTLNTQRSASLGLRLKRAPVLINGFGCEGR